MKGAVFVLGVLCAIETACCITQAEIDRISNAIVSSTYLQVAKRSAAEDNVLVSPFSLHSALTMLTLGSQGITYGQLQILLGLPEELVNMKRIPLEIMSVLRRYDIRGGYKLAIASKMYGRDGFAPNANYQNDVLPAFESSLQLLNLTENVQSAATMNNWVHQETRNKVRNLIDPSTLGANIALMLLNSIHFKAEFAKPFSSRDSTFEKPFYNYGREKVSVPMMTTDVISVYNYIEVSDLDCKFLELKFYGNEASLVIVLPNKKDGIHNLEGSLMERLQAVPVFSLEHVRISLPKFKIESTIEFKNMLLEMGLLNHYDKDADFSQIGGAKGENRMYKVVQKATIDVNEEGVEAAAATAVSLSPEIVEIRSAPIEIVSPKTFNVDHPFLYYIRVKGVVTFIGRVVRL